ncbi:hypothetical protein PIB30_048145 [Stylosanthes scabra]|uniref:Uncharacterized protein n=1 Tax=Stylosanthes scabra TaxID=79078 RepID=A0ABU6UJ56_9FABA|nr:hypothetical protein [Stylosanthes scabra]
MQLKFTSAGSLLSSALTSSADTGGVRSPCLPVQGSVPSSQPECRPADEIPVDATQRQSALHPERPVVPNVPDNRRPGRKMMVGMRTTARDWQGLDDMMADDTPAEQPTQKIRRMPESYGQRRGAGRVGRGGRGRGEGVTQSLPSKPDTQFDGSQVHLDLNEPVSGSSHAFMALGGTPP